MNDDYSDQISRIRQKLARSRTFTLNPPARLATVEAAERAHGITLPLPYRRFVLEVADGGRMNRWPLYPLADALAMAEGDLARAFPLTGDREHDDPVIAKQGFGIDGIVTIAYFGCTHYSVLVISGPAAGSVWYDGRQNDQGVRPLTPLDFDSTGATGRRPSHEEMLAAPRLDFLTWFECQMRQFG